MGEICKYVDVCIANEEDAADVFGIKAANTDVTAGEVNHEGYKDVAKQLADRFGFSKVAITLRESLSANDNNWSAMLYDGNDYFFSKKYKMHIVDRVGGGDSFGGGLICACLNGYDVTSSPFFFPINPLSNPSINCPEPMIRSVSVAVPPSKASPSIYPV